jgi:hypothetical protein
MDPLYENGTCARTVSFLYSQTFDPALAVQNNSNDLQDLKENI